jgi:hypothetical protein
MVNDDLVKCPLCGGFTHVDKPDVLQVLQDPKIRKQVDDYVSQLLASPSGELAAVGAADACDFQLRTFINGIRTSRLAAQPEGVDLSNLFMHVRALPALGALSVVLGWVLIDPIRSSVTLVDCIRSACV